MVDSGRDGSHVCRNDHKPIRDRPREPAGAGLPLGAAAVSVSPVDAFSDANGDFSLSIPSGIRCLFVVPDMQIHHILTPAADDTLSLTDLLDGDASGAWES